MGGSAQGKRVHGSRFTASLKRVFKKIDRTQDSPGPLPKTEASPARSAVSSSPPATFEKTDAAINAVDATTSTTSTSATGANDSTDKPVECRTDAIEACAESDLWSRAYRELDEKTKTWIGDAPQNGNGEERTHDLIKIVRKREEEYKDRTPKLRVGDQEIMWRDYANRVVAWVTAIGDISISFAPAPSSVVWSALKLLLNVRIYTQAGSRKTGILQL